MSETKRFCTVWRNRFLTVDAKDLPEMIEMLEAAVCELKDMQQDGVYMDGDGVAEDDTHLYTDNPVIADKYDFGPEDNWNDDEECDDSFEEYDDVEVQ